MVLIKRCHVLEEELAQAKKKTNTDTGVIEYLRKQVSRYTLRNLLYASLTECPRVVLT